MKRSFAAGMSLLALLGVGVAPALALTVTEPFQFRDNMGPNTLGIIPGDRQIVGANRITPSGDGTAAEATQGAVTRPLFFLHWVIFPDQYVRGDPFDPTKTDPWTINATRPGEDPASAVTNSIPEPRLLPPVEDLHVDANDLTPTVRWTLPELTDVERIRVAACRDDTNDCVFRSEPLPPDATQFPIPPGALEKHIPYIFWVTIEDREGPEGERFLENRSSTFTRTPYEVPEPASLLLVGAGLAGLGAVAWRRGRRR